MRLASYAYLSGKDWDDRISRCDAVARSCTLCPRNCRVDRFAGERGFCGAPGEIVLSSIFPHHGEEPPISGSNGSGTVFFSFCTLKCCFCQNYQISHEAKGHSCTPEALAEEMITLQQRGCHNINLVTATHFLPWVLRALRIASDGGLSIPLVYNCGGYEHADVIGLLRGIVDIYLPDMKYGDDLPARRYSHAPDYLQFNRAAIQEMFRQVGPLTIDNHGHAVRGLCVRHLVLPDNRAESMQLLTFLTTHFDPVDLYVSLMAQYRPLYKADEYTGINRMVTPAEFAQVRQAFIGAGFPGYFQDPTEMNTSYVIDFTQRNNEALRENDEVC